MVSVLLLSWPPSFQKAIVWNCLTLSNLTAAIAVTKQASVSWTQHKLMYFCCWTSHCL